MKKDNSMNLQEMQQFLSTERHEWQVPAKVKDKVVKMVERYNRRAIKKGYDTSTLTFDEATLTLSGLFMPKKEKKSFFGQISECGTNADLCSDFKHILDLCTAVCPHCHSLVAPSAKRCENCGEPLFKEPSADTEKAVPCRKESPNPRPLDTEKTDAGETEAIDTGVMHNGIGIRYEPGHAHPVMDAPDGVTYHDELLASLNEFIATQKADPKKYAFLLLALDLNRLDLTDDEELDDDDPRYGINAFDIQNVVFSKYNLWQPLFENKVIKGDPQIFITVRDDNVDLQEMERFAKGHGIPYALEKGFDRYDQDFSRLILSFDDDTAAAANFVCDAATTVLSVPRDIPISLYISACQGKDKAQKEYKKSHSFSARDTARGIVTLLKNRVIRK